MGLSDLKRKLVKGCALKMTYNSLKSKNPLLNKVRYVVKTQSNGVTLNEDINAIKGSFLEFPKNSLLEVTDKGFKVFECGERDLTEEEKRIMENQPKDEEQDRIDLMTDMNTMFYRRKAYFNESGYFYLFGTEKIKGKSFNFNKRNIRDDEIKGELSLEYEFI